MGRLIVALMALLWSGLALAEPRTLEVPPRSTWKHGLTGLMLPPDLAGLRRGEIRDLGDGELDIMAGYADGQGTLLSFYLYRPGVMSVPIWFDRSDAAIRGNAGYGTLGPAAPEAFASVPGGAMDSLRIVYATTGPRLAGTGLAVMPLGEWLVALRMSSARLEPQALRAAIEGVAAAIGWPAGRTAGPVAAPVADCSDPRRFKKARLMKPDMAQVLVDSMVSRIVTDDKGEKQDERVVLEPYCREVTDAKQSWSSYRPAVPELGYVIALGDAGRAIRVSPALTLNGDRNRFSIALLDLDKTLNYQMADKLPPPEQAVDVVSHTEPTSAVERSDGGVTLHVPAR